MEGFIFFDVANSAPPSECDDSEEIVVLSKTPFSAGNVDFSLEDALFSPTGVSALSSPKLVELILSSQKAPPISHEKHETTETKKKNVYKDIKYPKCRSCGHHSDNISLDSCNCYYCISCYEKLVSSNKPCICGIKIDDSNSNSSSVLLENSNLSKKYSEAMCMIGIIDMLTDTEMDEQQRTLINLQSTLVVKVITEFEQYAWEVPCEFTVNDLKDLVFTITKQAGNFVCNGNPLDTRLMLGFVRLYIWRKSDILTVNLS
ncbi:hypothetical protein SteCoe_28672 [Stentor coeruleus]|uniref:Uncharacterized protein n=1 Tax=Stentor coeruleus TaxID=5963 RepID=A0A1R2B7Q5_9CILI|nr:hypothetical protein SteCoe_28672 [Stentor coeruleus]